MKKILFGVVAAFFVSIVAVGNAHAFGEEPDELYEDCEWMYCTSVSECALCANEPAGLWACRNHECRRQVEDEEECADGDYSYMGHCESCPSSEHVWVDSGHTTVASVGNGYVHSDGGSSLDTCYLESGETFYDARGTFSFVGKCPFTDGEEE